MSIVTQSKYLNCSLAGMIYAFEKCIYGDFHGGPVVKNPSCNAGDVGSIYGPGTGIP